MVSRYSLASGTGCFTKHFVDQIVDKILPRRPPSRQQLKPFMIFFPSILWHIPPKKCMWTDRQHHILQQRSYPGYLCFFQSTSSLRNKVPMWQWHVCKMLFPQAVAKPSALIYGRSKHDFFECRSALPFAVTSTFSLRNGAGIREKIVNPWTLPLQNGIACELCWSTIQDNYLDKFVTKNDQYLHPFLTRWMLCKIGTGSLYFNCSRLKFNALFSFEKWSFGTGPFYRMFTL